MEKKCIVFTRVSTERQSFDEQEAVVYEMALKDGYKEENIIIISEKESGRKLTEEERKGLNRLKEHIEKDHSIKAVYAFELDRIGRKKKILFSIVDYLVEHKVDLIIKEPSRIQLLNSDCTINEASEMVITLFAQLAESEMRNKLARFKRSKEANRKAQRFNGGKVPFGYVVNEDNYFEVDPENCILDIFTMYSTGNYSFYDVGKEMQSRGFFPNMSRYNLLQRIHQIINNKMYIGEKNRFQRQYPPIITKELFDKCTDITIKHAHQKDQTKKKQDVTYTCKGLVKCPHCNITLVVNTIGASYVCNNCTKGISLNMLESVTWWAISPLYASFLLHKSNDQDTESLKTIELLQKKIKVLENQKPDIEKRIEILTEKIYLEGKVSIEKGEEMINVLNSNIKNIDKQITDLNAQLKNILMLRSNNTTPVKIQNASDIFNIKDDATRYKIIHEYVTSIIPEKISGYTYKITINTITNISLTYTVKTKAKQILLQDGKVLNAADFGYIEKLTRRKKKSY